jgi:C4-dicarboxylate transporter, DctM subunit
MDALIIIGGLIALMLAGFLAFTTGYRARKFGYPRLTLPTLRNAGRPFAMPSVACC